jgi:hypothetical protein
MVMIKLLRAWGAGITAFVNELSPFDFPILGDYVGDDATEDDGYLMWPTDSSCDGAAGAEDQVQAGVDAPSAPAWLPEPCLIKAAAIGLRDWIDSGACEHPTYWGWIARELAQ